MRESKREREQETREQDRARENKGKQYIERVVVEERDTKQK